MSGPIHGCDGCRSTLGRAGCPDARRPPDDRRYPPDPPLPARARYAAAPALLRVPAGARRTCSSVRPSMHRRGSTGGGAGGRAARPGQEVAGGLAGSLPQDRQAHSGRTVTPRRPGGDDSAVALLAGAFALIGAAILFLVMLPLAAGG